jgi:hypothetical protein
VFYQFQNFLQAFKNYLIKMMIFEEFGSENCYKEEEVVVFLDKI